MPKDNLKVLVTDKDKRLKDAKKILQEALNSDFEIVFVVGEKDGKMVISESYASNVSRTLGLLELLKYRFVSGLIE